MVVVLLRVTLLGRRQFVSLGQRLQLRLLVRVPERKGCSEHTSETRAAELVGETTDKGGSAKDQAFVLLQALGGDEPKRVMLVVNHGPCQLVLR